ncbi:CAP domain-containing protein [Leptospira sp. 96542]|nr:CAP domain-containing protein [Leptospira sp. 96542]
MKFSLYSMIVISVFFASCRTPQKKVETPVTDATSETKKVVDDVAAKDPNLAFLESIEDGRELPDSAGWKPENYNDYSEDSFFSYPPANQPINFANVDYPLLNAAIYYVTSKERRNLGLRPFAYSEKCEQAAFGHAMDMVKYDFYSHTSTVNGKETIADRLDLVGLSKVTAGENIIISFGIQYTNGRPVFTPAQNGGEFFSYTKGGTAIPNHTYISLAKSIVSTWFNSPPHRKNILNPDFSYMGAGAYFFKDTKFFNIDKVKAVQVFSSRP